MEFMWSLRFFCKHARQNNSTATIHSFCPEETVAQMFPFDSDGRMAKNEVTYIDDYWWLLMYIEGKYLQIVPVRHVRATMHMIFFWRAR